MRLTKRQWIVVWIGLGLIALMGLFPPWYQWTIIRFPTYPKVTRDVGYHLLFLPPAVEGERTRESSPKIDVTRLVFQWGLVSFVTAAGVLAFHQLDKRGKSSRQAEALQRT